MPHERTPASSDEPKRGSGKAHGAEAVAHIDGHELKLTNLDKPFWPDEAITKGDVIDYYRRIAPFILPYLRDRAQALHRHPNGIAGESFFQKDVNEAPEWATTVKIESESDGRAVDYLVCQDEATLVWMANLGCIEINPWSSRIQSNKNPDYLVLDLDPLERSFDDVIRVARAAHEILESIQAPSVPKTSGSTGLHIYVPLAARYSYDQAKHFAEVICQWINQELPELTSLERTPKKRVGKVYLDYLRNTLGQTMAAPYSLRPKPGAPVSTPLHWLEVEPGLNPRDYNIRSIFPRLEQQGDLWKPVAGEGFDFERGLQTLAGMRKAK